MTTLKFIERTELEHIPSVEGGVADLISEWHEFCAATPRDIDVLDRDDVKINGESIPTVGFYANPEEGLVTIHPGDRVDGHTRSGRRVSGTAVRQFQIRQVADDNNNATTEWLRGDEALLADFSADLGESVVFAHSLRPGPAAHDPETLGAWHAAEAEALDGWIRLHRAEILAYGQGEGGILEHLFKECFFQPVFGRADVFREFPEYGHLWRQRARDMVAKEGQHADARAAVQPWFAEILAELS